MSYRIDPLSGCYRMHANFIYRHLRRRCGSRALAEDLTSLTFEYAARALADDCCRELGIAWLVRVANCRLIDHWRREARDRKGREALQNAELVSLERAVGGIDSPRDPAVIHTMGLLSSRQRQALDLRYIQGYSVTEISAATGTSYRATESLLARSRRAFRENYNSQS